MTEPLRIVVICTMNRCRSPIGEASLRRLVSEQSTPLLEVQSAGIQAEEGFEPTTHAVDAARRIDLDISEFLSTPLTDSLLDWGNLFLGMERSHAFEVCNRRPELYNRTFTLMDLARRSGAFAREEQHSIEDWLRIHSEGRGITDLLGHYPPDDIEDPTAHGARAHRLAAKKIDAAVQTLFRNCFPDAVSP